MSAVATEMNTVSDTEKAHLLALLSVPEVASGTIRKLVSAMGSAQAVWEAPASLLKQHLPQAKLAGFTATQQQVNPQALYDLHMQAGITLLALGEENYPPMLAEIHNPPVLLFTKGSLTALAGKTLAIVGTRMISDYGRQVTRHLVNGLQEAGLRDAVIVSGLAAGIDSCAHWAALENGYATTAVFGCGLDTVFPSGNEKLVREILERNGALVSEYPLGISTSPFTFPQRNRIVVGLSHGVVVIDGSVKSGALITAKIAAEEGRGVYAVPGNVFAPMAQGPLHLLKQGAVAVTGAQDVLHDLRWATAETPSISGFQQLDFLGKNTEALGEAELKLLSYIAYDATPRDAVFEKAVEKLALAPRQINTMLTMLELDGHVKTLPGNCICRL